jgi:hypothetical protein
MKKGKIRVGIRNLLGSEFAGVGFDTVGKHVLLHLDSPSAEEIEKRKVGFDENALFTCPCPECESYKVHGCVLVPTKYGMIAMNPSPGGLLSMGIYGKKFEDGKLVDCQLDADKAMPEMARMLTAFDAKQAAPVAQLPAMSETVN